jgi:monomeric sarcosine oxidase
MRHVDVAVVGLGLAGAAAAWAVSGRGRSVAAFEAYGPGHERGSSHGKARIFRRAYLDPLYVDLTGRAGRLWDRLSDEAGTPLLTRTGGIDHGPAREPERMVELLRAHGVGAELLSKEEAGRRYPGMRFDGPAAYDPEGGTIDPEAAVAAMVRLAAGKGAHIAYDTPVRSLEPHGDGAAIHTDDGTWYADTVIVAAGAWIGPLLDGLVRLPPLAVTQQQVFFFSPLEDGPWPTLVHGESADTLDIYGLTEGPYVKVAEHTKGTLTTAATRDYTVDPAARDRTIAYVRRWLPGLDPEPRAEKTCLYTSTANEDFVIDRRGPFVVCSPCSGHGAKFTPLIGELAADLVDGLRPIERFALP